MRLKEPKLMLDVGERLIIQQALAGLHPVSKRIEKAYREAGKAPKVHLPQVLRMLQRGMRKEHVWEVYVLNSDVRHALRADMVATASLESAAERKQQIEQCAKAASILADAMLILEQAIESAEQASPLGLAL